MTHCTLPTAQYLNEYSKELFPELPHVEEDKHGPYCCTGIATAALCPREHGSLLDLPVPLQQQSRKIHMVGSIKTFSFTFFVLLTYNFSSLFVSIF